MSGEHLRRHLGLDDQRVEDEALVGQHRHVVEKPLFEIPGGPDADAPEQGVGGKTLDLPGETGGLVLQAADVGDDCGVVGGDVEDPLVALDGAVRFYDNGPGDALGGCDLQEMLWQDRPVKQLVVLRRPGNPLRPRRIVDMGVGVDDHAALVSVCLRAAQGKDARTGGTGAAGSCRGGGAWFV